MEIYPIDLVLHIINIIVLFVVVRALAYKPIRNFMRAREEQVKNDLDGAAQAKAEAQALKAQYEAGLAGAEQEKSALLAKGYEEAAAERDRLLAEAKTQADGILAAADEKAKALTAAAMTDAQAQLASAAVSLAGKVLCFDEAARTRAMTLSTKLEGETTAQVKAAAVPEGDALAEMKTCLENLCGKHLQLSVAADESLLGGFVAYIDGQVYDFSYAAQLQQLQRTLA